MKKRKFSSTQKWTSSKAWSRFQKCHQGSGVPFFILWLCLPAYWLCTCRHLPHSRTDIFLPSRPVGKNKKLSPGELQGGPENWDPMPQTGPTEDLFSSHGNTVGVSFALWYCRWINKGPLNMGGNLLPLALYLLIKIIPTSDPTFWRVVFSLSLNMKNTLNEKKKAYKNPLWGPLSIFFRPRDYSLEVCIANYNTQSENWSSMKAD